MKRPPSSLLGPQGEEGHGEGPEEESHVGQHLEAGVAAHAAAVKVSANEVNEGHVDEDAGGDRVEDPLHHQCPRAVRIVHRRQRRARRDPRRRRDREEARHESRRLGLELRLQFHHRRSSMERVNAMIGATAGDDEAE